jgi:hypothetical protein
MLETKDLNDRIEQSKRRTLDHFFRNLVQLVFNYASENSVYAQYTHFTAICSPR